MKFREKKTGKVQTCDMVVITDEKIDGEIASLNRHTFIFRSIEQFNDECEAYKPTEPLIKDEEIRRAVQVWAEANNRDLFRVINRHFNCCEIIGYTDGGNASCDKIGFSTTIAGANKDYYYTIAELCGEEEEC